MQAGPHRLALTIDGLSKAFVVCDRLIELLECLVQAIFQHSNLF